MTLAGQVHSCWKCLKRLPIDNVRGAVVAICPKCKSPNAITVQPVTAISRERC
jgi:phage FluMu protein Com